MTPSKLQPALFGGIFIGVLSALPIVSAGNLCCCLWIVGGGVLAAYLMQQGHPQPIQVGDGAVVGLLAGVTGAVVSAVVSIPIRLATGPLQAVWMSRWLDRAERMPPELKLWFEALRGGGFAVVAILISFVFMLIFGVVFGTIGGMLGVVLFKRVAPPPSNTLDTTAQ